LNNVKFTISFILVNRRKGMSKKRGKKGKPRIKIELGGV